MLWAGGCVEWHERPMRHWEWVGHEITNTVRCGWVGGVSEMRDPWGTVIECVGEGRECTERFIIMCPHTTVYVSSYYYLCPQCKYVCPHTDEAHEFILFGSKIRHLDRLVCFVFKTQETRLISMKNTIFHSETRHLSGCFDLICP